MKHGVVLEEDPSTVGCGCSATYRVVEYANGRPVRVLGQGIARYEVAVNVRDLARNAQRK